MNPNPGRQNDREKKGTMAMKKKMYSRSSVPTPKRVRLIFLTALFMALIILYYSASTRRVQSQEFYKSTVGAMKSKTGEARDPANDEEEALFQKLKPNYGSVPERPPPEVPDKPKFEVPSKDDAKVAPDVEEGGEERSVAGRKTMKLPKGKETTQSDGAREDPAVEQEMNNILKRSPIIIFSKSYCPFSTKAKSILLNKYNIVPSPFVVELDEHPLGRQLQNLLAENTDRHTVPNILISGLSVGGGDEIAALHEEGKLIEKVRSLGDKRIVEVSLKDSEA